MKKDDSLRFFKNFNNAKNTLWQTYVIRVCPTMDEMSKAKQMLEEYGGIDGAGWITKEEFSD